MTVVAPGVSLKSRVVAIIQARMGSERLPGKMLLDLAGKPLLAHVIDRVKMCELVQNIVVATPDEELARYAYTRGVWGYHDPGDPRNVLARYIKAGGWSGAQIVVRITGDCPLIDPKLVDQCVKECLDGRYDIVTNVLRRRFPKGMDVEVMHLNVLKRIYHLTADPWYREHVTLFAYDNPALFVIKGVSQKEDFSHLNLCVDTKYDLDKMAYLVSKLSGDASYEEIIKKCMELEHEAFRLQCEQG